MSDENKKGLLSLQQFLAVFGVEPGRVQRWIKFGMPVEEGKKFDLVQVGQWIVRHLSVGYMTLEQTAEMFGVEVRTITKWKNEFGLPQAASGFYKRNDVVQWREKYLNKKIKEMQAGGEDGLSARQRMYKAKAIREEYKQAVEERSLIRIDEVMPIFEEALKIMKQRITVLPRRSARLMEGTQTSAEREEILRKNVNEILTELSNTPDALRSVAESARQHYAATLPDAQAAAANVGHRVGRRKSRDGKRKRSARTRKVSKRLRSVPKRTPRHIS